MLYILPYQISPPNGVQKNGSPFYVPVATLIWFYSLHFTGSGIMYNLHDSVIGHPSHVILGSYYHVKTLWETEKCGGRE